MIRCPKCNLDFQGAYEAVRRLFAYLKTSVQIPQDVCPNCGAERRKTSIRSPKQTPANDGGVVRKT